MTIERENAIASLTHLKRILSRFSSFDPKMQLSTVMTLLEIAAADIDGREISVLDIEKAVGLLSGTASRNVYYWGEGHKDMKGGHNFIKIDFGTDRRKRSLRLTPKGNAFISNLVGDIGRTKSD